MPTESIGTQDGLRSERRPASPRARRTARAIGIDLTSLMGTGPGGRILEEDVVRFRDQTTREGAQEAERMRVSPAARKLAMEMGVPLEKLTGTGPRGRIVREDVLAALPVQKAETSPREAPVAPAEIPSVVEIPGGQAAGSRPAEEAEAAALPLEPGLTGRIVPLSRKRRLTAEKMALSSRSVAQITLALEVDMAEAMRLRDELLPPYESQRGVRISYNDILVLVAARALREHPYLNARWTDQGILLIDQINVGLAIAVSDGLVVPVIKDAAIKTLPEIGGTTSDLVARAREGKLSLQDVTGGTFTITNLGGYGVELFTPIVNPPEAAILGAGKIVEKPVVRNGQVVSRPRMTLALSADHRVVDGAPAAEFLARIQQLLETPYLLL